MCLKEQKKTILTPTEQEMENHKRTEWMIFFFLSVLYFIRIAFLDADIKAPWGLLNYQPFDEGCYGRLALNVMDFGYMNPNMYYGETFSYLIEPNSINNIVGNLFCLFFLKIFGDNYWGFRMSSIVTGYLVFVLFHLTLKKLVRTNNLEREKELLTIRVMLSLSLLCSFVFYNACRIVEPSIYRLLFVQMIIYLFVQEKIEIRLKYFLIGFLMVVSVFLVYITNIFVGFGLLGMILFLLNAKEYQKIKQVILWCALGAICAYFISFAYYKGLWDRTPIMTAIEMIFTFGNQASYALTSTSVTERMVSFASSNVFLYNPLIFGFFLIGIPTYIHLIIKKEEINVVIIGSMIIGLFLHTLLSEDYIVRKSLIIYPAVLYLVYYFLAEQRNKDGDMKKWPYTIFITLFIFMIIFRLTTYRLYWISNLTNLDFQSSDKICVLVGLGVAIVHIFSFLSCPKEKRMSFAYIGLGAAIVLNMLWIVKYNFYDLTWSDRAIMKRLGMIADGQVICFSYENSNTLYNDIFPLLAREDQILEYMKENPDIYYYGFADFPTFNTEKNSLNQNVDIKYVFKREFMTMGEKREWGLFVYSGSEKK